MKVNVHLLGMVSFLAALGCTGARRSVCMRDFVQRPGRSVVAGVMRRQSRVIGCELSNASRNSPQAWTASGKSLDSGRDARVKSRLSRCSSRGKSSPRI